MDEEGVDWKQNPRQAWADTLTHGKPADQLSMHVFLSQMRHGLGIHRR